MRDPPVTSCSRGRARWNRSSSTTSTGGERGGAFPMRSRRGDRVLDLGGGPGTYAVAFADACPGAEITVFDTQATLRVARKILRERGAAERVRLVEGDFLADPLGGPYDFAWISQILHAYSGTDCVKLLRRARSALAPGGRVAVQEVLLAEGADPPPVQWGGGTGGGRAYTGRKIAAKMTAVVSRKASADAPDARGVGILRGV